MPIEKLSKAEHETIYSACQQKKALKNTWNAVPLPSAVFSYQKRDGNSLLWVVYINNVAKFQHIFVGKKDIADEETLGYDGMWRVGKDGKVIDIQNQSQNESENQAVILLLRTLSLELQRNR